MANKNFKARIGIEAPLIAADNGTTAITLTGANVEVAGDLTVNDAVIFDGATSGTVTIAAPAVAGTQSYTLPTALPAVTGYVLSGTTGGALSWVSNSDANTTYTIDASTTTGGANLNLVGSDATTDTVAYLGSGATTVARTNANTITISSTDTNTTYTQNASTVTGGAGLNLVGSDATTDTVEFKGSGAATVTRTDANTINIAATDTNTTYDFAATSTSGGANLNLTGSDSTTDTVKVSSGTGVTVAQVSGTEVSVAIGQAVGTGDSPSFAGVTGGNITVGVATDQTITTTSGNLILDSAGGTLQFSDATLSSPVAQTWNIVDNTAAALSFNTTGKTGLISIDTTDSAETINMSGVVQVDSSMINRFTRTAAGTGSNATIAVNRTRTDAARAVDGGPWYAFEYVGTDNTQATSLQNAIRSRYQTSGNHVVQFIQAAGDYATVTAIGQIARGATSFNNTSGGNMLALTDTTAILRGTTTSITNSGNTTTYASFASSAHTIGNIDGVTTFVRASGATAGTRPVVALRNSVTTTAAPATGDGASFRQLVSGSNGTVYNLTQISGIYNTSGDSSISFDVANGDQTGSTMTTVRPFETSLSTTVIKATASPTATPGGNTLSTIAIFSADRILNNRAHRNAITTATVTEGATYTPAATDNNSISLTINTGSGTTVIDLINLTGQGTGGMYTILVHNNAASGTPVQVKNTRINTNNLTTHTITTGDRIIINAYVVGDYATATHLVVA